VEKPAGYSFVPGQATELSINKIGWRDKKRPFTFTSLDEDPYLEFTIKCYDDHDGVTAEVRHLSAGEELIIGDPWGAIEYKGPGCFIAGGAGITPFLAIIKRLSKDNSLKGNQLLYSNKTAEDIICREQISAMLGGDAVFVTTDEKDDKYPFGYIDKQFLKKDVTSFDQHFYVCGPEKMVSDINTLLVNNGALPETVIFEK
jgi:ferredoxin-NADP reductase